MLVPIQAPQMTYLTDRQVAQNLISKGDIVLRWYDTRWAEKIVRPVDVADGALSPLGQIFDHYDEGLRVLSLTESEAAECGFVSRPGVQTSHVNDLWNQLVLSRSQDSQ
jgi:hypothetical protein